MFLIWLKCINFIWLLEKGKWKNSQLFAGAKSNQISKKGGAKIEQKHTNIPENTNILPHKIFLFITPLEVWPRKNRYICDIIPEKKCDYMSSNYTGIFFENAFVYLFMYLSWFLRNWSRLLNVPVPSHESPWIVLLGV